jgi:AcrR family transcriptional regulator
MTVADITYHEGMVRWEPDSRGRLAQAAMALFAERGFDNTTVADIAERAGVTERTFFRHFADKREVLFEGAIAVQELLVTTVAGAPESAGPLDAVAAGLYALAELFQERRDFSRQRRAIIDATPELRERELIKLAAWATSLAEVLRGRGVPDPAAALAAETGVAVFKIAWERWTDDDNDSDFRQLIRESLGDLKAVTTAT